MDQAIKQRWVDALRSGKFPQTQGALHRKSASDDRPEGYCCLGVLCGLAVEDDVIGIQLTSDIVSYGSVNDYSGAYLSSEVIEWAELNSTMGAHLFGWQVAPFVTDEDHLGRTLNHGSSYSLADLNDSGLSFNTIAKLIEVYL